MILERYILRNYIGPFIFSMSVITFVFIMDFILNYIDLFLGKGVAFHIVMQVFLLSLGHMFALIIPMAVLPATLMTFGNLASENEITAMKAVGVSMYRMIIPGVLAAGARVKDPASFRSSWLAWAWLCPPPFCAMVSRT